MTAERALHPEESLQEGPVVFQTLSAVEQLVRSRARSVLETRVWRELTQGWESGEISRQVFDYNDVVRVYREHRSIARSDVGNRPVILTAEEVERLRVFDFVFRNGDVEMLDPESVNGVLILLPEDFGDPR